MESVKKSGVRCWRPSGSLGAEPLAELILPVVGVAGDIVFDGAEAVIGTTLIATLLLPYLAPASVVQQNPLPVRAAASKSDKTNDFKIGWWIGVV
jgi:hypothetical protein